MTLPQISLIVIASVLRLAAQDSELPLAINLPTAESLQEGQIGVRFTHRFLQPARTGSKDLYGLDNGNYPGLGVDVGIKAIPGLNAQLYRTADDKTIILALQQQVLKGSLLAISARVERFDETVKREQVATGIIGIAGVAIQLPAELHLGGSVTALLVPTYLSRTTTLEKAAFNVGAGMRWQVTVKHALLAEYYPRPSRLDPDRYRSGAAIGYGFRTRGHRFTLLASNMAGTTAHQVLAGDYGGGPRAFNQWALGFNLVRLF
ncbi:MAG TPA: DUF5777 family beta-barrel protein [Geothrix sp.]|nr:DUF5777 family beta-barrel protein [Geothrix sp.]